ncbi:MAG TPA: CRISPR-associated helicase Cas3', partial [Nitrolancea sp.]|nr:CRISPR-associated helicase Cas3' [Nitrolancea sp.]
MLTGFLILCDWLGSDEHFFPPESSISLADYPMVSRARAERSVTRTGFLNERPPVHWSGFGSVFPAIDQPRPLQEAIEQLPVAEFGWPSLYIIEAPTGEGKTEAALALARMIAATGPSDEFYFALPTTATSNQMHDRVREYLDRIYDGEVAAKLIHGQAALYEESLKSHAYGSVTDLESPAASVPVWFSPKKLALLAPFGVGTVDQAELTVLSARHYMLRLFGLAGKVVIIDEVHAYDTYMSTIIDHALRWLASIGTSVILLSATLPVARHREMARAFLKGLSPSPNMPAAADEPASLPYPVIALYGASGMHRCAPEASQSHRLLEIEFVPDRVKEGADRSLDGTDEAQRLLQLVEGGGAICRITNTVDRAQAIYRALRDRASSGVKLYLVHARMPGDDRLLREQSITERVGPDSDRSISDRIIVVGTQVLEQSLDLDFDYMISDHAPLDLLLQRAGRLHRHRQRERPAAFQSARLDIVLSLDADGGPKFGASAFVYQPFVLWKSWLVLRSRLDANGRVQLSLPDDYRPLIEATYDGRRDVLDEDDPFRAQLETAWNTFQTQERNFTRQAKQRLIPDPLPGIPMSEGVSLTFDEDDDGGHQGWGFAATR